MDVNGLYQSEVLERKNKGLVNDVEESVSRSYKEIILGNTLTWFNMILFGLGAILLILNNPIDALFATGIMILNILIATIQECKAKRRLDSIALLIRPTVKVIREGKEAVIDKNEIVMDDIISIGPGDQLLVDGEMVFAEYLELDESVMTGESSTVKKREGDKVLSGSFCIAGNGYYKVTAVGKNTVAYKMMDNVKKNSGKNTPLQWELLTLIKIMIGVGLLLLVLIAIANFLSGDFAGKDLEGIVQILVTDAVLATDVVPLALFLTIIISYMVAAIRMADSGVLLQRSNSVESMSHVDTVCMDKTGTITTQKLLFESMKAYTNINDAKVIIKAFANSTGSKNRTVQALINHYGRQQIRATEEIRFSSERKFSAVKINLNGETVTIFAGAITSFEGKFKETDLEADVRNYSKQGLRTLVIAKGHNVDLLADEFVLPDLTLVALVAIRDEIRPECRETINGFIENGMDIKVISGDDPVMVDALFSIAKIPGSRKITSGPELEKLRGREKIDTILESNIFGRMKPEQKEEVIRTLREEGRYVAMVGDGVNDVRSLKEANVGISLESGTSAAKGVSDMVLLKDNFSSLPKALVEGKRTISGMGDLLKVYISRNFTFAILLFLVSVLCCAFLDHMRPLEIRTASVYAALTVSIPTIMLIIWAKPTADCKTGVLPNVLRYTVPMALLFSLFGFALFMVFQLGAMEGIDFFKPIYQNTPLSKEYIANGQGVLFWFLLITGVTQLFFVVPYSKFFSLDGVVRKDIKPVILAFVLYFFIVGTYLINDNWDWFHELFMIPRVPLEHFPIIILWAVVWFFVARAIMRSSFFNELNDYVDKGFVKRSEKLNEQEAVAEAKKDEFWKKVDEIGKQHGKNKN